MEIFLRNLPQNWTRDNLAIQLKPCINQLHVADDSYQCEKTLKKRFATITFLDRADGQRFLDAYGQLGNNYSPRHRANVATSRPKLLNIDVFCEKSRKDADSTTLRFLTTKRLGQQEQSQTAVSTQRQRDPDDPISFEVSRLDCGHYGFSNDGLLTFFPEFGKQEPGEATFLKRNLIIKLGASKLRIPINSIEEIVWAPAGFLTLTLRAVPSFYCRREAPSGSIDTLLNLPRLDGPEFTRLTALGEDHAEVVGMCLIYRLTVSRVGMGSKIHVLDSRGVLSITRHDLCFVSKAASALRNIRHQLKAFKRALDGHARQRSLPFEILFQLQALVCNAYLSPATVEELASRLVHIFKVEGDKAISTASIKKLFLAIDWPHPNGDPSDFQVSSLLGHVKDSEHQMREGLWLDGGDDEGSGSGAPDSNKQRMVRIHRVTVTPTWLYLGGPELERENRVLRMFPHHHDYFVRVQFADENGQDLRFNTSVDSDPVYDRFKKVMRDGIEIAGRLYKFLGWSNSSLKAHAVWFVAGFVDSHGRLQSFMSIIRDLGEFESITSPARYAARVGQAFSETPFAVPIADNGIAVARIEDVKSADGARTFSDGVGTVSPEAAEIIWRYLPSQKKAPTCFQIRFGGAKGMLALDSNLTGRGPLICLRPSMIKFETKEMTNLEICDMSSKPIPLVLNRQMVKLLEDMDVPESWFLGLQEATLRNLRGVTASPGRTADFLQRQAIGDSIRLHKLVRLADRQGFDYRRCRFLRRVVEAVVLRELRLVKHKARIPVDCGITLFGIMDETGFLEHDQVYTTFDPAAVTRGGLRSRRSPPPSGHPVLVTRSPALHPGDIQRATNKIPPNGHPLRELVNCLVFSSKGVRDLPSQLSGGDLDGDIYNVIWDEAVVGARTKTFPPANYPRQAPVDIERRVEVTDMAQFFVDYMRTDKLGVIAMRHMNMADQRERGTHDDDCRKLAEMHSTAVDFTKTGIPVNLRDLPRCGKYRPDFLAPGPIARVHDKAEIRLENHAAPSTGDDDDADQPTYEYYRSDKVLGKLYRAVDERLIWEEDIHKVISASGKSFWDQFLDYAHEECRRLGRADWRSRQAEAVRIWKAYEDAMLGAMADHSEHPTQPLTELEMFIGHIVSSTGVQTRRQRDRSGKLRDEFGRISAQTTERMRGSKNAPATGYVRELDEALELCLACVCIRPDDEIGAEDARNARRRRRISGLESFRLVAASALLREIEYLQRGREPLDGESVGGGYLGTKTAKLTKLAGRGTGMLTQDTGNQNAVKSHRPRQ